MAAARYCNKYRAIYCSRYFIEPDETCHDCLTTLAGATTPDHHDNDSGAFLSVGSATFIICCIVISGLFAALFICILLTYSEFRKYSSRRQVQLEQAMIPAGGASQTLRQGPLPYRPASLPSYTELILDDSELPDYHQAVTNSSE